MTSAPLLGLVPIVNMWDMPSSYQNARFHSSLKQMPCLQIPIFELGVGGILLKAWDKLRKIRMLTRGLVFRPATSSESYVKIRVTGWRKIRSDKTIPLPIIHQNVRHSWRERLWCLACAPPRSRGYDEDETSWIFDLDPVRVWASHL